jgi:hypothetical protein
MTLSATSWTSILMLFSHIRMGLSIRPIDIQLSKIITTLEIFQGQLLCLQSSWWVPTVQLFVCMGEVCFRPEDGSSLSLRNTNTNTLAYLRSIVKKLASGNSLLTFSLLHKCTALPFTSAL